MNPIWLKQDFYGNKYQKIVQIDYDRDLLGFICNPRYNDEQYSNGKPNFPIHYKNFRLANKFKTKLGKLFYENSGEQK